MRSVRAYDKRKVSIEDLLQAELHNFFCFAKTKTKRFFVLGYLFQIIATNSDLGHKGAIHR